MNLVIYAPSPETYNRLLRRELEAVHFDLVLEIHRSAQSLAKRLRRPVADLVAAILFISGERQLLELLSFKDLLWDLPTILIMPDRNNRMIAQAHNLRPRFLTDSQKDCGREVLSVLNRMLDKSRVCSMTEIRGASEMNGSPVKH